MKPQRVVFQMKTKLEKILKENYDNRNIEEDNLLAIQKFNTRQNNIIIKIMALEWALGKIEDSDFINY